MNVSAWSIRNPIPAVMLFVLLTFGGLLSFQAMKVQNFPDIDLPTVSVTASLPGAAPAQLETEVARKLENSIATLQGLKHITTKVQDGGVTITAEFRLEKPVQEAVDDVRAAVARVRADLPADLRDPSVTKASTSGRVVMTFTAAAAAPAGHLRSPSRMPATLGSHLSRSSSQSTVASNSMPNGDSKPSIRRIVCSSAGPNGLASALLRYARTKSL
mgnify:CR=1 FL=1